MKTEIKYVELKSGFSGNGPAWIGLVSFSKSEKTIYFDGKAFQRIGSDRVQGNFYDIESGEEYWISGVKKDLSDRHQFGGGVILVEKRIIDEYLSIINNQQLTERDFELTEVITEIPTERINTIENQKYDPAEFEKGIQFKKPNELKTDEINFLLSGLEDGLNSPQYKKTRRSIKARIVALENELSKRLHKEVK